MKMNLIELQKALSTLMPFKDKNSIPSSQEAVPVPNSVEESGPEVIARILKTLPNAPGVYRMLDRHDAVLYVGKAKSLKKRVASYTRLTGHTNRIARMITATVAMEFITTATEAEALLLEANLIKKLKPRYNVILRDDKSFPYILIARDHEVPQLLKHRGVRRRKGDYFGPFASAGSVNRALNTLQRAFLLRSCADSVYENRTRPCLLFQIKRCAAPCTGEISLADYDKLVREAVRFLSGKSHAVQQDLARLMEEAAEKLDYERAAVFRDRLTALTKIQAHQGINPRGLVEADVFAARQEAGQTCVQVFFFRTGKNWGNRAYYPRAASDVKLPEVLDAFLGQFYANKPVPKLILTSHKVPSAMLIGEALSARVGHKVHVSTPQRGEKRALVAHALDNAREALERRLAESASQRKLFEDLCSAFDLEAPPRRIEVYDNSHIQGSQPVGAMIVSGREGFLKNHYRKFNIRAENLTPGDDYAMMREVLTRRFTRLLKQGEGPDGVRNRSGEATRDDSGNAEEDSAGTPLWPDLILIDGGRGQLSAAHQVLDELGVGADDVAVVGIAKGVERNAGRERFYKKGQESFILPPRDPVLYFVQRLRDEAHRFAIGAHRTRRKKDMVRNPLDAIPGIGPARKRALLRHFGSAKAVSQAGITDLQAVEGISAHIAQTIYDHFHEG